MFEIFKSEDRLNLLKKDFYNLERDCLNISLAEKCCIDSWHMVDWVYNEVKEKRPNLKLDEFRKEIFSKHPDLSILHDISNTIKHKSLTRPKAFIKSSHKIEGTFDYTFDTSFEVSALLIELESGRQLDLLVLIDRSINFWNDLLKIP